MLVEFIRRGISVYNNGLRLLTHIDENANGDTVYLYDLDSSKLANTSLIFALVAWVCLIVSYPLLQMGLATASKKLQL